MFKFFKQDEKPIDLEIERVLSKLSNMSPESDGYQKAVTNLKTLYESRSQKTTRSINMDTVLTVGGNLLGILLILNYEQAHVVVTKAITFVMKGKL